jgi:N-acylneuraminate cytidylyltransferase
LIAWTIEKVKKIKAIQKIIVSTESLKISEIYKKSGAEVPFLRPKYLSGDRVGIRKVILHGIRWIEKNYRKPKFICCIYPTAALLKPIDLKKSLKILKSYKWNYIFSAIRNSYRIERAFNLTADKRVVMIDKKNFLKRSQDFKDSFHDAGQFYWGTQHAWLHSKPIFSLNAAPLLLPRHRVQDIDTPQDWLQAEQLFAILPKNTQA